MHSVSICIELGEALRSEELLTVELIEDVVAVSLQAHFDLVVVKKVCLGGPYADELANDGGTSLFDE